MKRRAEVQITQLDPEGTSESLEKGSIGAISNRTIPGLSSTSIPVMADPPNQLFPTSSAKDLHMYGLNKSFQEHVSDVLSKNRSSDLSRVFDQYLNHIETINRLFGTGSTRQIPTSNNDRPESDEEDCRPETLDPYVQDKGEDGEKTEYATRCKIYAFSLETKSWMSFGIASLRLNSKNGKYRVLARSQDSTKRILLNFNLFQEFKMELDVDKNRLSFIGLDENRNPIKYLVQTKNKEEVEQLSRKLTMFVSVLNK